MRFNFGMSRKHEQLLKWHKWFAWMPVIVGPNEFRWLEYVERKAVHHPEIWPSYFFSYRAKKSA